MMNKVLIIEDDPAIQLGLRELFKNENYEVSVSGDGGEGLTKALKENPDIILLDINLPVIGGLDICRKLRENKFFNPIIMLTSRSEQTDKIVGLEVGADDYITKPFDNREVLARVRANLRRSERDGSTGPEKLNKRKLLSILFSDMKEYSKKMHQDEESALELLRIHNEILNCSAKAHNGTVVETIGDSYLISFISALDAVKCSINIQKELENHNKSIPDMDKIEVRIAIHLGDVLEFENKLKGDVLNIAARILDKTPACSIYISEGVYQAVKNKSEFRFEKLGDYQFKNISDPVVLYNVVF